MFSLKKWHQKYGVAIEKQNMCHWILGGENCYRRLENKGQHMLCGVKTFGKSITCDYLEIRPVT